MVERQLPKLHTRVRFPPPAPAFYSATVSGLRLARAGLVLQQHRTAFDQGGGSAVLSYSAAGMTIHPTCRALVQGPDILGHLVLPPSFEDCCIRAKKS
jgi:hypothetical protein